MLHSWLVQKNEVAAFCVAGRADGGHGALIVLLRAALAY
jgi:DNA-nicking Smr family endonuclease